MRSSFSFTLMSPSAPVSAPKRIQLAKGKYGLKSPNPSFTAWSAEEWITAETQGLSKHTPLTKFPPPLTFTTFHKELLCPEFQFPKPAESLFLNMKNQISISPMRSSWVDQRRKEGCPCPWCCTTLPSLPCQHLQ